MEGEMGREVAVWWGPDSILSALGFGTRENMEAVRAGRTNLSAWHDGTPVCRIDPERFAQLAAERAVAEYTPAERLALLTLGEVIARSGVSPANERTLILLSTTKGNIGLLNGDPAKCDLNDTAWFSKIDASEGAVFFAAGVFYYFLTPQVKALVCAMAEAFPGGKLVFDAANRKAVKLMLKTWLKDAEIKDVGAYFAVTDARRELSAWSDRLRVSSRGYMLGYNDLRNQNVRKFFRFLSKVGDGMMNMQIVRLDFAKENKKHE